MYAAAFVFGHEWRKIKILFICDNTAVVFVLKRGRSKCSYAMKLMRKPTLINGFYFSSDYINTKLNITADLLPRNSRS